MYYIHICEIAHSNEQYMLFSMVVLNGMLQWTHTLSNFIYFCLWAAQDLQQNMAFPRVMLETCVWINLPQVSQVRVRLCM